MYLGDFKEDTTNAGGLFTSRNTTGEASALTSGLIACYKMSSTIETTAGLTLTSTFDNRVGLNRVQMDLSSTAFYAASEEYGIVLTQGTVNGVSVAGETLFHFSISNRYQGSTHTSTDVFDQAKNAISTLGVTTAASTHTSTDIFDQAKNALSTYGVTTAASTHTSTDVFDQSKNALSTYGVSTHTSTNIFDQAKNAISTQLSTISDAVWEEAQSGHVTNGTMGAAAYRAAYMGPMGVGVYINISGANTNTVAGTDGTVANPVSTVAAAKTIADALGTKFIYLIDPAGPGILQFTAAMNQYHFYGIGDPTNKIIDFASQNVGDSLFQNLNVRGPMGTGNRATLIDCEIQEEIGAGVTTLHALCIRCGLVDEVTFDTSNDNVLDGCYSMVAGGGAPIIRASGAAGTLSIRHYSGGLEFASLSASHKVSVEGQGQIIFGASCNVNAEVVVRGHFTVTDNTAGMSNFTEAALINMTKIDTSVFDNSKSAISTAGVSTHTSTDIFDQSKNAISTLGVSTHTSTNIFDQAKNALTTKGVSTHTSTNIFDQSKNALTTYGVSTHTAAEVMTAAMTESYTTAATPTPAQLLFETNALLAQFAIASTVYTAYQRGSTVTAAATWELNDSTSPTALKRTG